MFFISKIMKNVKYPLLIKRCNISLNIPENYFQFNAHALARIKLKGGNHNFDFGIFILKPKVIFTSSQTISISSSQCMIKSTH